MAQNKLICVIGATGNQGGSVARRFHKAGFRTRDASSPAAQKLVTEGIEVTKTDLDGLESLKLALKNANVIFSVTNYWEPFFRPDCRQDARGLGISPAQFAYDVEYRQGKNIADAAAATCDSLDSNSFLVSTLSHAAKSSQEKFKELYHFDSKADIFPFYVRDKYPDLAAKMSCIQTGYFYTSFNILPDSYFGKASNASTIKTV
ncbi:NmrA-like family domain-containing protein 1 [Penicillium daleae]|uniref:NmrA-like family domain-containing protein 1 n=1 Tax=Penicillium daleae TaxID=63821 RepID=A0AAD6G0I0_9EURO|nr:NmrA-like family domain-containing protein 1 [Penicillium daleae]KAJ5443799.1 NmrA-like family domain-containing protein 1 [Penicillium daleae]